jgi:hypothetical protein
MKNHFNKLVEDNKNSQQIWKAINELTNKHKQTQQAIQISPHTLNTHFSTVADRVIQTDKSKINNLEKLRDFCDWKSGSSSLQIAHMHVAGVYKSLNQLKQNNTRGLDGIDNKILKLSAPYIAETLTYIYNLCIDKCTFPSLFKQAKVIPLYKSGDMNDPSNYRPISILSSLSKPLERHINSQLQTHLLKHNLLHSNQSGFRPNHSCHTALTTMVEQWLENINNNRFTGALFVDFSKAFDVIDHDLLIRKLEYYKLSIDCIKLIRSFLCNRQQSVCINRVTSDPLPVDFGVPQGSVLGPLLFSVYINDLPLHISQECEMFADDTTIHTNETDISKVAFSLQKSANELQSWTEYNHMALNPSKTEVMLLTTRQKRQNLTSLLPTVTVCNQPLKEIQHHKILGVTIDNNLSWSEHIKILSKNVAKKAFQLSRIKHFLNPQSRKLFYTGHIQSAIDYASTLWDSASGNTMKPLISAHRRAIKSVVLKPKIKQTDFVSIGILPLTDRLKFNKGVFMRKILAGKTSTKLSELFTVNTSRGAVKLNTPIPRLDLYKSSLVYSGTLFWNNLPRNIQQKIHRPQCFKDDLLKHFLSKT